MKSVWLAPVLLTSAMSLAPVMAADTPPTPKLQKADKPLIDLGSELGTATPKTSTIPRSSASKPPQKTNPVRTLNQATETSASNEDVSNDLKYNGTESVEEQTDNQWSYMGNEGPKYWGDLSPKNILCKEGKNQSPVDLRDKHGLGTVGLAELEVRYRDVPLKTMNNGHFLKVNYPLGSYIKLDNKRYELLSADFHTPSEHQKEGFNYPMELQLIHRDGDFNFVNIAVLFQEGEENESLQVLLDNLPKAINKETIHRGVELNPVMFIPTNTEFYKYSGSLTSPPCSEGVYWMVFKQPIEASAEQIQQMNEVMGENARPIQPLNARNLLKSWSDGLQEPPPMYEYY